MIIDCSGHHHHHHDRACHHDHYQDHLPLCCCHIIMILKNASFSKSFGLTTDQDYYTNVLSGVFPGRILALSSHLDHFDTFTSDETLQENGVWLHFSSIFKRDCAKTLLEWNSLSWTSPPHDRGWWYWWQWWARSAEVLGFQIPAVRSCIDYFTCGPLVLPAITKIHTNTKHIGGKYGKFSANHSVGLSIKYWKPPSIITLQRQRYVKLCKNKDVKRMQY